MMTEQLDQQDLHDILDGACILASGGGGPYALGEQIVPAIGAVTIVAPADVSPDTAPMAVAAGLGAPDAAMQPGKQNIGDVAAFAYTQMAEHLGTTFSYVMPGELGAGNSLVPLYVGSKLNLPVVDVSGAPRAMPLLDMTTFEGHVPVTPVLMTNGTDVVVYDVTMNAVSSSVLADGFARAVVEGAGFGELAGVSFFQMTAVDMRTWGRLGTLSAARALGRTLREAKANGADPVAAVAAQLQGRVLFVGDTCDIEDSTGGGFDSGRTTLTSTATGETVTLVNQNENIIGWSSASDQPIGMGPDLLCYLTTGGRPFSNADPQIVQQAIAAGERVAVIGVPASQFGYRTPGVIAAWMQCAAGLGYLGKYVPIEDLPAWQAGGRA